MDGEVGVVTQTISLNEEAAERLARLSADVGCSAEQIVQDALLALEHLLDERKSSRHAWTEEDDAAMRQAIADIERGNTIPHEQVMTEGRKLIDKVEPFTPEQVKQIESGLRAMREGRMKPSSEVFARLDAKYGG